MASPSPFLPSASITTATVSHYATNVQGSSSTSTLRPPPNPPNPPTVSVPVTIAEPIETSLDVPVTPTRPSTPSWDRKRSLSTGAAWNDAREPSGFTQTTPSSLPAKLPGKFPHGYAIAPQSGTEPSSPTTSKTPRLKDWARRVKKSMDLGRAPPLPDSLWLRTHSRHGSNESFGCVGAKKFDGTLLACPDLPSDALIDAFEVLLLDGDDSVRTVSKRPSQTLRPATVDKMGTRATASWSSASSSLARSSTKPKTQTTYHHPNRSKQSVRAIDWSQPLPRSSGHVHFDGPFAPVTSVPMAKVPSAPPARTSNDLTTFKFPVRTTDMARSTTDPPVRISSFPHHSGQQSTSPRSPRSWRFGMIPQPAFQSFELKQGDLGDYFSSKQASYPSTPTPSCGYASGPLGPSTPETCQSLLFESSPHLSLDSNASRRPSARSSSQSNESLTAHPSLPPSSQLKPSNEVPAPSSRFAAYPTSDTATNGMQNCTSVPTGPNPTQYAVRNQIREQRRQRFTTPSGGAKSKKSRARSSSEPSSSTAAPQLSPKRTVSSQSVRTNDQFGRTASTNAAQLPSRYTMASHSSHH